MLVNRFLRFSGLWPGFFVLGSKRAIEDADPLRIRYLNCDAEILRIAAPVCAPVRNDRPYW